MWTTDTNLQSFNDLEDRPMFLIDHSLSFNLELKMLTQTKFDSYEKATDWRCNSVVVFAQLGLILILGKK